MDVPGALGQLGDPPREVEGVLGPPLLVEGRDRLRGVLGTIAARDELDSRVGRVRPESRASLVPAEVRGQGDPVVEVGEPDGDVEGAAAHVARLGAVGGADDVDECLADDEGSARSRAAAGHRQELSAGESRWTLVRLWWASTIRVVPDLLRMTSDSVVAPPARYRTPRSSSPSVMPVATK